MKDTIETVFRSIISGKQLSIYGAVSDLCEEYKSCHARTGRLVLVGQSYPLFVPTSSLSKTHTLLTNDPAHEDLLKKFQERVERLSQQNRVIKFCTDAGFLTTVEVGQFFMTKHTQFILHHQWTYVIMKNAELEAKHQKYKGRVVLRGDIVKDDSGSSAVFTEQGSSASQMTAAKVMDIISTLLGCDGQAADAVSAKTQVKMEDAPKLLRIPKSECPDIWIRLPQHKWPKSWSSMEDPVVPLERNLYRSSFGRTIMGKAI